MPINDKIKKLIGGLFGIGQQEGRMPRVGSPVDASPLPVDGDTPITAQRPRIVPEKPIGQDVGIQTIGGTEQVQGNTIAPPPPQPAPSSAAVTNDPAQFQRVEPTPGTSELGTTMAQKPQSFMSMGDGSMPGSRQYMFALGRGEQPEADAPVAEGETATPNSLAAKPKTYTQSEIERRLNKELYKGGKDADKDHNWWDVVKSAALGFREGGLMGAVFGGVEGAFDPNADERMGNKWALGQLQRNRNQEMIGEDREAEQERRALDIANIQSQIDTRATEAARKEKEFDWEKEYKTVEQEIRRDRLLFDKEKAATLAQLRRDELAFRKEGDAVRAAQAQQRIDEMIRSNKVKEGVAERRVAVQEKRASIAAQKASEARSSGGGSRNSGGKSRGGMTPSQMAGWQRIAQKLDDDFNAGAISEEAYNNMIAALEQRILQSK